MSRLFKRILSVIMTATLFFSNLTLNSVEVRAAQTLGASSITSTVNSKAITEGSTSESKNPVEIIISDSVKIEGYQISSTREGSRVVGSVEPTINGQKVTNWGFIYSIIEVNGIKLEVTEEDMYVGSDNEYVNAIESTALGTSLAQMGNSETAIYFVRTTIFVANNISEFTAKYKVRAYAVLEDGSYVYSEISSYNIFDIAEKLYQNKLMSNNTGHEYLYNSILSIVNPKYEVVDYNWGNAVVKPSDM